MNKIQIPARAYMITMFPQSESDRDQRPRRASRGSSQLRALSDGLAVPCFWSRAEITQMFADANRIWEQADIEFVVNSIVPKTEVIPADDNGMWIHFINNLRPAAGGVAVGFVYDLPSNEGGWGGGRIAVLSGKKARMGLSGFGGGLLAHELGHVLFNSPSHHSSVSNLMYGRRHPRIASANLLETQQINTARTRAARI